MITISDNGTALEFWHSLGPENINATLQTLGLGAFHIATDDADDNTASARVIGQYFSLLAQKKLVSAAASDLKAGKRVTALGSADSSGAITATPALPASSPRLEGLLVRCAFEPGELPPQAAANSIKAGTQLVGAFRSNRKGVCALLTTVVCAI